MPTHNEPTSSRHLEVTSGRGARDCWQPPTSITARGRPIVPPTAYSTTIAT